MGLVVPEWVARNERRRKVLEDQASGFNQTRYWNPLLKDIDHRLELVFVGGVDGDVPGVVPFRWHILRRNEAGPDTYRAVVGRDGEFRDMGSDVLEDLRSGDLWEERVRRDIDAATRRADASRERAKDTHREARVGEVASNLNALTRPSVLVGDVPWTNRPAGKRGRKAKP